jgi:hypothetical protein
VDFVLAPRGQPPVAIECKWSADAFNPSGIRSFRGRYPGDRMFVVSHDVERGFGRTFGDVKVRFVGLSELIEQIVS